jgi:hypothetical protein
MIYNALMIFVNACLMVVVLASTPIRGDLGLNLSNSYYMIASFIGAFVTSVSMFKMSVQNDFAFVFNCGKSSIMKSRIIKYSLCLILLIYAIGFFTFSVVAVNETYMINTMKYCLKTKEILSPACSSIIQRVFNIPLNFPMMVIPLYTPAYCYLIGKEFEALHQEMLAAPNLFGMSDSTIER